MRTALCLIAASLGACDDGDAGGTAGYEGRFEITARAARATCDDAAPWDPQPIEVPGFRLAPIEIVGTPLLGYFPCDSEGMCADGALLVASFGQYAGGWWSMKGDLRSTDDGCAMEMRAGPLVATDDGLELVVSHYQGTLALGPDACFVDALEARFQELPCLDQVRWVARRVR